MNTHTSHNELKDLFKPRPEDKEIEHDALMLMAGFLSEIEYFQDQKKVSRKDLATKIKTSASYLTQVFRSRKPLNFVTLAKMKRALNLRFEIKAYEKEVLPMVLTTAPVYKQIEPGQAIKHFLKEANDMSPSAGSRFLITEGSFSAKTSEITTDSNSINLSYQ